MSEPVDIPVRSSTNFLRKEFPHLGIEIIANLSIGIVPSSLTTP